MSLVSAVQLAKTYRAGDVDVPAVRGVDFAIEPGSFVAFVGPSGSGKSTLLNMIGCLDKPSSGRLTVLDTDVATLDRRAGAEFRGRHIGFIFQDFNLIPVLTAYENIEYPLMMVQNWPQARRREQVMGLLSAVGMADQAAKRPDQLSGGQKQRVAIARAILKNPRILIFDEATSALDSKSEKSIQAELNRVARGHTTLVIAHRLSTIMDADQILVMDKGGIVERGTHRELLEHRGHYAQMWLLQQQEEAEREKADATLPR